MRLAIWIDGDNGQAGGRDLQYRQIGHAIGTHQRRFKEAAILQRHDNLIGIIDHMLIGKDVAFCIHDHP